MVRGAPKERLGGPKMAPRGPKKAPTRPQDGPRRPQDGPKTAPRRLQDAPQTNLNLSYLSHVAILLPSCRKMPLKCLQVGQDAILDANLAHFGSNLASVGGLKIRKNLWVFVGFCYFGSFPLPMALLRFKIASDRPRWPKMALRWPQDGPKTAPR